MSLYNIIFVIILISTLYHILLYYYLYYYISKHRICLVCLGKITYWNYMFPGISVDPHFYVI